MHIPRFPLLFGKLKFIWFTNYWPILHLAVLPKISKFIKQNKYIQYMEDVIEID